MSAITLHPRRGDDAPDPPVGCVVYVERKIYIRATRSLIVGDKMDTAKQAEPATSIRQFLVQNTRQHDVRAAESNLSLRQEQEIEVVREATHLYLTGELGPLRLEGIKDFGRQLKGNPWGVTPDGSSADAKIQKDMKHICASVLLWKNSPTQIVGKELNKNAVIFLDQFYAEQLIKAEKDAKKQAAMKDRLQAVASLRTREGYERKR
jgi:hypothetical protein